MEFKICDMSIKLFTDYISNLTSYNWASFPIRSKTYRYTFLILSILFTSIIRAQQVFDILVPLDRSGKITQLSETAGILEQLRIHAKSLKKEGCFEIIKSSLKDAINNEIFFIHLGTPYQLLIDYNTCAIVSLQANLGTGSKLSSSAFGYEIQVYEQELFSKDKTQEDVDNTPRHALLATYQENGKWVAIGPYNTTDEYGSEQEAIARLHYGAADMKYVCKAGKYKVYGLNKPLEYDARDVRKIIEETGGEFPDDFTDKKLEGFNGYRKSELIEKYDGKVEAQYSLYTSATKSRILAKFTNLSDSEQALIIVKPKDGKLITVKLPPGARTNLVFYGSDFEAQVVYDKYTGEDKQFDVIDFIKGVIRKHVTKEGEQIKTTSSLFGVRG